MKIKYSTLAVACLLFLNSHNVNAGLISGTHTFDDGRVVALQDLEWMSLDYTAGLSRADIEDGFTDRYGTEWAAGEWTYATRQQTETLLGSLWGGVYDGWSADNAPGAAWFINYFAGLGYDSGFGNSRVDGKYNDSYWIDKDLSWFVFGEDGACSDNTSLTCAGKVEFSENSSLNLATKNVITNWGESSYTADSGPLGQFYDYFGLNNGQRSDNHVTSKTNNFNGYGSLLVRAATEVPEPASLTMLVLGLLGLRLRRKKLA